MLAVTGNKTDGSTAEQVPAFTFRHHRDKFCLIDVREASEVDQDPVPEADLCVPMGQLISEARSDVSATWKDESRMPVLLCTTGYRAALAAQALLEQNIPVKVLQRGLTGFRNAAATVPDFVVVLGTKSSAEKLSLAMAACSAASSQGETVVLVLLGEGVSTFLKKDCKKEEMSATSVRVEETFVGEPFKPCHAMLKKFLGSGHGIILACQSCVKNRGLEYGTDLLDDVNPMQMPDLLRMLGEAKKSLQFM